MLEPFLKIVSCLNSQRAKYVVIGGNAAIYYGVPRATFDLDLLVQADEKNLDRVLKGLRDAGMGTAHLTTPERVLAKEITIFDDWVQVDIQTRTPELRFAMAWKNRKRQLFRGVVVPFVSRVDLMRSKRAAGRDRDLQDVKVLETVIRRERRGE